MKFIKKCISLNQDIVEENISLNSHYEEFYRLTVFSAYWLLLDLR
jgi:hypothetical protein